MRVNPPKAGAQLQQSTNRGPLYIAVPRKTIRITGHDTKVEAAAFTDYDPYYDSCRYSWVEVWVNREGACGNSLVPGGFVGFNDDNPAVEINGATDVPTGVVVEAWLAPEGDHWLFNNTATGTGGSGTSAICCIGAPFGIYAFASQTCCDNTVGFDTGTFYLFWDVGCVPHIYTDRQEAIDAATSLGLPVNMYGECEPVIEDE